MNKNINKKIIITGLSCAFLLVTGLCYSCSFKDSGKSGIQTTLTDTTPTSNPMQGSKQNSSAKSKDLDVKNSAKDDLSEGTLTNKEIYIHLCGAVAKPGVYRVQEGARLSDLIKLAGGLSKNAAGDYINQAKKVTDGQRIYIPTVKEVSKLSKDQYIEGDKSLDSGNNQDTTKQTDSNKDLIDINTATAEQLMNLPGVGQSKAESIISYRTKNGQFKKIEDVMKISGIKEGLFGKIKSYICVK